MEKQTVDLIIPTYQPDEKFSLLLQALQGQTCVVHKVIIMNTEENCWTDFVKKYRAEKLLQKLPVELHHIPKKEFDHGGTRMQGVSYSDAPYFICMTQDAVPADNYLSANLCKAIGGTTSTGAPVAAGYARQLAAGSSSLMENYMRQFNYPPRCRIKEKKDLEELGIKTFFCSNVCAVYNREIFDKLGGFEKRTIFNEDMIYAGHAVYAGYGIAYAADALVVHSHNYTARQQKKRYFDLGVSQAQHPEVFAEVKSESEGMKSVAATAKYLLKKKKPLQIFSLISQNLAKYVGYKKGFHYKKLKKNQILKYTSNKGYWNKQEWDTE